MKNITLGMVIGKDLKKKLYDNTQNINIERFEKNFQDSFYLNLITKRLSHSNCDICIKQCRAIHQLKHLKNGYCKYLKVRLF